jgi:hypothetical protein
MNRKVEPTLLHINKQEKTSPGNWIYEIRTVAPHNPAGKIGRHIASLNDACEPMQYAHLFNSALPLLEKLKMFRSIGNVTDLVQAQIEIVTFLDNFEREMREHGG